MISLGVFGIVGTKLYDFVNRTEPAQPKKSVLVVGYGWAGKSFCDTINRNKYDITVHSKTNYALNTPKLKNNIFGTTSDLFMYNTKPIKFIEKEVDLSTLHTQPYDYIVVAVGSTVNDFNIPGVKENCYFLKTKDDLEKLRPLLQERNKHIVIAGAGPAGIELAFELSKHHNISLIEAMPTILPNFSEKTRNYIQSELQKYKINLLLNHKIEKIEPNKIQALPGRGGQNAHGSFSARQKMNHTNRFATRNGWCPFNPVRCSQGNQNSICFTNFGNPSTRFSKLNETASICPSLLSGDIIIWNCGVKPNGIFPVDNTLKYKDNIYAIGDVTRCGPPTAQNAKQQGQYLATLFNNDFKGESYKYVEKGKIIHTNDKIVLETAHGTILIPIFMKRLVDTVIQMV